MEEKPCGALKRNERLETFTCESCGCMFTQEYCEYWHWVYHDPGLLMDNEGNPILDDNGRWIKKKCEWKLMAGNYYGRSHTHWATCPFCNHAEEIKLNKKKFQYLKRRPPTEDEELERA